MANWNIPQCIAARYDELNKLCEDNPFFISVTKVAAFLGMNPDGLRACIERGQCPFGISWIKSGKETRGFKIPTATFYTWYTGGAPIQLLLEQPK